LRIRFKNWFVGNLMRRLFIAAGLTLVGGCSLNQKNIENTNSCIAGAPLCDDVERDKLKPGLRFEFDKFINKRDKGIKNTQSQWSKQEKIAT